MLNFIRNKLNKLYRGFKFSHFRSISRSFNCYFCCNLLLQFSFESNVCVLLFDKTKKNKKEITIISNNQFLFMIYLK